MTDFLGLSSFILLDEGEWLWYILCNYFDVSLFPVLIYLQVKLLSLRLKPKVTMQNLVNCYAWIGESFLKHPILMLSCHMLFIERMKKKVLPFYWLGKDNILQDDCLSAGCWRLFKFISTIFLLKISNYPCFSCENP